MNNRIYPKELWDNTLKMDKERIIKECLLKLENIELNKLVSKTDLETNELIDKLIRNNLCIVFIAFNMNLTKNYLDGLNFFGEIPNNLKSFLKLEKSNLDFNPKSYIGFTLNLEMKHYKFRIKLDYNTKLGQGLDKNISFFTEGVLFNLNDYKNYIKG